MKRIFEVRMFLNDGSTNIYNVSAKDDLIARELAVKMEEKSWKDFGLKSDNPGLDFCEIKRLCDLDN